MARHLYLITMAAACCPDDSWPALTDTPYECQGVVETLDESSGFKVYKVGAPNSKCIIWNYDIYGFEGGRTRKMADFIASQGKMIFSCSFRQERMKINQEGKTSNFPARDLDKG